MIRFLIYLFSWAMVGREALNRRGEAERRLRAMPPRQAARVLTWAISAAELLVIFFIFPRIPFFRSPFGFLAAIGLSYWGHRLLVRTVARRLGPGPPARAAGAPANAAAGPKIINVFAKRARPSDAKAEQTRRAPTPLGLPPVSRAREIFENRIRNAPPLAYYGGLAALYLAGVVLFVILYRYIAG